MCRNDNCDHALTCAPNNEIFYCMFYNVGAEQAPTGCEIPAIMDELDGVITLTESV